MKELLYRVAREALANAELTAEEIRSTIEAAIESDTQQREEEVD